MQSSQAPSLSDLLEAMCRLPSWRPWHTMGSCVAPLLAKPGLSLSAVCFCRTRFLDACASLGLGNLNPKP